MFSGSTWWEGKTCVTLVSSDSAISNIWWANRKSIVDLWYRTTVNFLTLGYICDGPIASRQTLGGNFRFPSREFLTKWTGERDNRSERCVTARGHSPFTRLQRWAICNINKNNNNNNNNNYNRSDGNDNQIEKSVTELLNTSAFDYYNKIVNL